MARRSKSRLVLLLAALAGVAVLSALQAADEPKQAAKSEAGKQAASKEHVAVKPKPLSENVRRGLEYLVEQQHADGGWGQGGGWRTTDQGGRIEGPNVEDPSDVADTCMATLVLLRSGNTPREGTYARNIARAIEIICSHVEKSDSTSLYVTNVRGTQPQTKIGPYADTFLTSIVLAEVKGKMPAAESEKRLVAALEKTVHKIEKNQAEDGTFAGNNGWAPIFSQGLASKGLNRAMQAGVRVDNTVLARADKQALASLDVKSGTFAPMGFERESLALARGAGGKGGGGRVLLGADFSGSGRLAATAPSDAGVRLYSFSAQTSSLQEAVNTNIFAKKKAEDVLADKNAPMEEKKKAEEELGRIAKVSEAHKVALKEVVNQLGDRRFVQGFGSNGGEEFLSYLNIGETLVAQGGPEWEKWDRSITDNLNRIQNKDGSWSGDHCITGRTFCTASALLVLMVDRTPVPVAGKLSGKK
jgi:hypothetical protein